MSTATEISTSAGLKKEESLQMYTFVRVNPSHKVPWLLWPFPVPDIHAGEVGKIVYIKRGTDGEVEFYTVFFENVIGGSIRTYRREDIEPLE